MSRCLSCNEILTDRENTRRYATTGEYLELCEECTRGTGIAYTESIYRDELDRAEDED